MRAVGIVIAAFTTLIGLVSCADPAPSPPMVQPATVSLRTATPFPLSSAIPVLTSHQGIAAISDTLGGAGFACTRNERFLSCRSATDGVRVSAFDEAGAAVEIDGVIFPNAPTDETNVLLALLDQIAPGTDEAARTYLEDGDTDPRYAMLGHVYVTMTREEGTGDVAVVLKPA